LRSKSSIEPWHKFKERYLSTLLEERLVSYLDPGAEEILLKINSLRDVVTTSSCIGRITIIEAKFPWERREESRIVFKSHYQINEFEVALIISRDLFPLWLKVTGPIVHIRARSLSCASKLLEIARRSGFKHSGIISIDKEGPSCCTLEINSSTQMITPLKTSKSIVARGQDLKAIVKLANEILLKGRRRLELFVNNLEEAKDACS